MTYLVYKLSKDFVFPKKTDKKFSDVIGLEDQMEEIKEVTEILKNPQKYLEIGAYFPKGILLTGPPGVGKTLIAKSMAGESNCYFIYISSSQLK